MTTTLYKTDRPAGADSAVDRGLGLLKTLSARHATDAVASYDRLLSASKADSRTDLLKNLAPLAETTSARFVAVSEWNRDDGESAFALYPLSGTNDFIQEARHEAVAITIRRISTGASSHARQASADIVGSVAVLAIPGPGQRCLVAGFDQPVTQWESALLVLQTIAMQIGSWFAAREAIAKEAAAARLAAMTELLGRLETAATLDDACRSLADELQSYLGCQQVVVGLCRDDSARCRVAAISQIDAFHADGEKARIAQAALQEAIARGELSVWPALEEGNRYGLKALEQYAVSCQARAVIGAPLRDELGKIRGAWLGAGGAESLLDVDSLALLRAAATPTANVLHLLGRVERGRIARFVGGGIQEIRRRRGQAALVALMLALAAMFLPVPFRVKCDCQLEPVTRRFVAAPFDGPLKETFVEPGDLVTEGQLLAQMDGREIRWELAGVQADLNRATTKRAGHVASHEPGEAEVARHEVDRLRFREQLLKGRGQDLEVRSPVDGIVVSGDRKDAQGMPLKVGEVLFEVAPLDAMIVELAIPEDDMMYVSAGMPVRLSFDAFPMQAYRAQIDRVHPRAELHEERNVFIAKVRLENRDQILHPGMRGTARIDAGRGELGWILFRRPLVAAMQWLGW